MVSKRGDYFEMMVRFCFDTGAFLKELTVDPSTISLVKKGESDDDSATTKVRHARQCQ
jgi:hypothetical protein